jgi:glutamate-1-semialdehyde 2,1-aminomutase
MATQPNSVMKNYNQRVKKLLPGGVHYNFRLPWEETPIHFVKADKSRLWDMDGQEYLDLYARFGALIVGHGNKEYNESLKDVIDRVLSVSHCDMDAEALELIARFVPSAEMIRFGLSGTEIVQNALRLADLKVIIMAMPITLWVASPRSTAILFHPTLSAT